MSSRTQGIHNSEMIDDLRDIDPSVKQTSRVGTVRPSMATSSKLQLTAVAECGGHQEGRGGERSLPDPFNYTSCSVADSYSSQTEGDREFKDLLFIRAQSLGTRAEAEAQGSQETMAGVGKLGSRKKGLPTRAVHPFLCSGHSVPTYLQSQGGKWQGTEDISGSETPFAPPSGHP